MLFSRFIFLLMLLLSAVLSCRQLHPELQSNLVEFRQHLVDSTQDMAPLKVWQLQGTEVLLLVTHTPVDIY